MTDFKALFQEIAKLKVAVVGDVMLDTYWWGNVERISPEAPVPIVGVSQKEYRLGGAGNVALNTISLLAQTAMFTVVGDDDDAGILKGLLQRQKINTDYIVHDAGRPTTNKIRIMGGNQQMMRLDNESVKNIPEDKEKEIITKFQSYVAQAKPDVVILEDYNKGLLTESLITAVIDICKQNHVLTTVDPKKKNFLAYKGVDIFKPNLKEVAEALHLASLEVNEKSLGRIHEQLYKELHHRVSLITLSEKGVFYASDDAPVIIPGYIRNIADVSGAGDTVISVASLVYAATNDIHQAATIANIAGGLVCEEVGTAAINRDGLIQECGTLLL